MDNLHVLEGTMNAERYKKGLEQHMLYISGKALCIYNKIYNVYLYSTFKTTEVDQSAAQSMENKNKSTSI